MPFRIVEYFVRGINLFVACPASLLHFTRSALVDKSNFLFDEEAVSWRRLGAVLTWLLVLPLIQNNTVTLRKFLCTFFLLIFHFVELQNQTNLAVTIKTKRPRRSCKYSHVLPIPKLNNSKTGSRIVMLSPKLVKSPFFLRGGVLKIVMCVVDLIPSFYAIQSCSWSSTVSSP